MHQLSVVCCYWAKGLTLAVISRNKSNNQWVGKNEQQENLQRNPLAIAFYGNKQAELNVDRLIRHGPDDEHIKLMILVPKWLRIAVTALLATACNLISNQNLMPLIRLCNIFFCLPCPLSSFCITQCDEWTAKKREREQFRYDDAVQLLCARWSSCSFCCSLRFFPPVDDIKIRKLW